MKPLTFQQAVARQFNKAAKHYHQHDAIQRETAKTLLGMGPTTAVHVLDVGCGPGTTTEQLRQKTDNYTGVDLALSMLTEAQERHPDMRWLNGQWESLPVANSAIDWLFANLSVQWVPELHQAAQEAFRVLKPGGVVTMNTLVDGTFSSFIQAWQHLDDQPHTQRFLPQDVAIEQMTQSAWQDVTFVLERHVQYFPDLRTLMASIKGVGANYVARANGVGLMTRRRLQQLEQAFERYRTEQGLALEWCVLNASLVK